MTRILIVSPFPNLPGGVTNYVKLLHNQMDKEKFELKYLHYGKSGSLWKDIFYPFLIFNQILQLKKILKNNNFELVHINPSLNYTSIVYAFIFLKIIKKNRIPVLFFIHGWQKNISKTFNSFFRKYFKNRFELADAIVVLANEFKKELIELGIIPEKIIVSTTMVEFEKYYPGDKDFSKPYKILFCANMKKVKGPFAVLDSAPTVLNIFPETKFIFVGSGKDLYKLKEKAKEMKLIENIEFAGYVTEEQKREIFKKSHIFAYPTEHGEGFPTVVLEAMAAGMPIVTTAIAGLKDALENGKQGFIIKSKPPNPKEISENIIKLLEDEKNIEKISGNNLKEVNQKYDVKVVCKQIENIYLSLLDS